MASKDDSESTTQEVESLSQRGRRNPSRGTRQSSKSTSAIDDEVNRSVRLKSAKKVEKLNTSNSRSKVNVNQHGRGSSYSRKPNQTKQSTSRSSKISAKPPHSLLKVNELEDSDADQPPSSLDYDTGSDTSNDRPCVKCEGVIDDFTKAISC